MVLVLVEAVAVQVLLVLHLLLVLMAVALVLAQLLVFQEVQFNTLEAVVVEVGVETLISL